MNLPVILVGQSGGFQRRRFARNVTLATSGTTPLIKAADSGVMAWAAVTTSGAITSGADRKVVSKQSGAPNPDLAEVFINYVLDFQVGADISNFTAYASPNQAAIDAGSIDEAYLTNPAIYPDEARMQQLFYVISSPTLAPIYTHTWEQLKTQLAR
ncbi:MAG TPA: hypothetical protein VHO69_14730 [Phototrophicaceae bacterium]|nr:hypothetical protein [Phototrophicaceae bacterium]